MQPPKLPYLLLKAFTRPHDLSQSHTSHQARSVLLPGWIVSLNCYNASGLPGRREMTEGGCLLKLLWLEGCPTAEGRSACVAPSTFASSIWSPEDIPWENVAPSDKEDSPPLIYRNKPISCTLNVLPFKKNFNPKWPPPYSIYGVLSLHQ